MERRRQDSPASAERRPASGATGPPVASSAPRWLRPRDLAFLLGGAVLILVLFCRAAPRTRWIYDEADYMVAAGMGFRENYVETSSLSFPAYLRIGLRAASGRMDRTELSEYIRGRNDVSFYRHYHGPLFVQWLTVVNRVASEEWRVRAAGLAFHLLAFVTVFAGLVWLLGPENRPAAFIASTACLFSPISIRTSLGLTMHQMFAWLAILTLFVIARFLQTARSRHLLLAIGCASVAMCALEYGVLLFLVLGVSAWPMRRRLLAKNPELSSRALLGKGLAVFLSVCALLWPAGLYKLSILKAYLMLPYLALMRKDSYWLVSVKDIWLGRLKESPLEYVMLMACLVAGLHLLSRFRSRPEMAPFVLFASLVLLITFTSNVERYLSSAVPALYVVGGVVLAERSKRLRPGPLRPAVAMAGFAVLLLNSAQALPARAAPARPSEDDTVSFVSRQQHRLRSILVPAPCVPTIHYYVPEIEVRSYVPEARTEQVLRRVAVAPVDALFVYRAADAGLGADIARRLRTERVMGPDDPDPTCGPFVVYFLEGRAQEASWSP